MNEDFDNCNHNEITETDGYFVCRECGECFDNHLVFENNPISMIAKTQSDYERMLVSMDVRARQDPAIAQKYRKLQTLETWFRDSTTSFNEQKKTISLLENYGFIISETQFEQIKREYMHYVKNHKKSYENMVINFLAIVWLTIKNTTNKRIEEFMDVCNELGHKISRKMITKAIEKMIAHKQKKRLQITELEQTIKTRIKALIEKDLNNLPFKQYPDIVSGDEEFEHLKMMVLRLANSLLEKMNYDHLRNLNYKAFTAGFIYFLGQCLGKNKRKLFVQTNLEIATTFSTTTIRNKFNTLKEILGNPETYRAIA